MKSPFDMEERNYSDRTADAIDTESRRILDSIYGRVKEILLRRADELHRIAEALVRKETLERAELNQLLEAAPALV